MNPVPATAEQLLFCRFDGEVPDLTAVEWWVAVAPSPPERTRPEKAKLGDWGPFWPGEIIPVRPGHGRSLLTGGEIDNSWTTVQQVETFEAALALREQVRDQWNFHPERK